jgi:dTDP-4-dehydrorhamnose reductase
MRLALIGANGNVGTELCFLLRNDIELKPIVRNKLGAIFLNYHGFKCTIADISRKEDAQKNLSDVDIVVISSYATDHFTGSQTQSSKFINEQLIKNSINFSTKNAIIIYFSTIRAFSHRIDHKTSRFWTKPAYDKEKKHLEQVLLSECKKNNKRGFAFRIGHVFGGNQPRTKEIKRIFSSKKVSVRVCPERKSNVVHTVTIKNAILRCLDPKIKNDVYSIVNNPQWTWKDVFEYYKNKETIIDYTPIETTTRNHNDLLWKILKANKRYLIPIRYYIPRKFDKIIQKKLAVKRMMSAIDSLKKDDRYYSSEFDYEPIPGPFIPGLHNTIDLLANHSLHVFDTESSDGYTKNT